MPRTHQNIQLRMPMRLVTDARDQADHEGVSLGQLIRTAIAQYIRQQRLKENAA